MSILYNTERPIIRWERITTTTSGIIKLYVSNAVPIEVNAYYADTSDSKRYFLF